MLFYQGVLKSSRIAASGRLVQGGRRTPAKLEFLKSFGGGRGHGQDHERITAQVLAVDDAQPGPAGLLGVSCRLGTAPRRGHGLRPELHGVSLPSLVRLARRPRHPTTGRSLA